ncbi:MAG: HTH domain-containing protein [Clostridia bacterium]|nr:HTH domain-containing protein [Clostridia bacterium]
MSANDRIQWFHQMVFEQCYPNASHLAERFSISTRQAQRDVEYLRRELGAPLEYSSAHKGYRYSEHFTLPLMLGTENDTDYHDILAGIRYFSGQTADRSVIQMQVPYTALLEIKDRMTVLNLRSFIVGEEPHHRYRCEFPSVELFLGIIMSIDADIRVVSPEWMKNRLLDFAERVLRNNRDSEN